MGIPVTDILQFPFGLKMSISDLLMLVGGIIFLVSLVLHFVRGKANKKSATKEKESQSKKDEKKLEDPVESTRKGKEFEDYVIDIFAKRREYFNLLNRSHDKMTSKGNVAADATDPDLKYSYGKIDYKFAVECKYKDTFFGRTIEVAKNYQLTNYKNYEQQKNQPTFIILGVGGEPNCPNDIFIIPVKHLTETKLSQEKLEEFRQSYRNNFFFDHKERELRLE